MKKIAIFAAIMVVGAGVALASTLSVPFFLDNQSQNNGSVGVVGRIGVKEASGADQTITVIYTALNASGNPVDQTVTFALGANESLRWNPVQTNTTENANNPGSLVPNVTIQGPDPQPTFSNGSGGANNVVTGSALIIGSGALSGSYSEIDLGRLAVSVHVLLQN